LEELEDRITPVTYNWTGGAGSINPNWSAAAHWGGTAINAAAQIDLNFNTATAYAINNDLTGLNINSITFSVNNITLQGNQISLGNPANSAGGSITVQSNLSNEKITTMGIQLVGTGTTQQFLKVNSGSTLYINSQI